MNPQQKKVETETFDDRHKAEEVFTKKYDVGDIKEGFAKIDQEVRNNIGENLMLPASDYNRIVQLLEKIEKYNNENENVELTEDERILLTLIRSSALYTTRNNIFVDNLNENMDRFVNDINFADKKINVSNVSLAKSDSSDISGTKAINYFRSYMSVGELIRVPLWHSGFWVLIKPPTQSEIINLQMSMANNEITLGRQTQTLAYSNYNVINNRILIDFIIEHINQTSIANSDDLNLRQYICIHDLYLLANGMLSAISPEGVPVIRHCVNASEMDETGKPKCGFVVSGSVDPKKLLWVNRKALTQKMLTHMSNKNWDSMTLESVKEYQKSLASLNDKDYEITASNGAKFTITFGLPTLDDNLTRGEEWVNEIISSAETIFADTDTEEQKNTKINTFVAASALGIYNTFVKGFKFPDGKVINDKAQFNTMLSDMSADIGTFNVFLEKLNEYITQSPIAMVAIPSFTCPTCQKNQNEGKEGPFKEFIPLDIISHFFALCDLRMTRIQQLTA